MLGCKGGKEEMDRCGGDDICRATVQNLNTEPEQEGKKRKEKGTI